jgi:arylsulfatase A-like enzyme
MPTFAELLHQPLPGPTDGVSILPTLDGLGTQKEHEYLYWEFQGKQAVRMGDWKAYRAAESGAFELYDLETDRSETTDVADVNPEVVARITQIMDTARTESELFPLRRG